MMQVLFSSIQERIISEINQAQSSILIAVAWFNNREIYNTLLKKAKSGIKIELIIVNDEVNNRPGGLDYQLLIDSNVKFYFADSARLMHNKFSIYDGYTLLNGSYNWTYAAESRNKENIIIFKNEHDLINQFTAQFEQLKPKKSVFNVKEYLKEYPPTVNALGTEVLNVDEDIIELDIYDSISIEIQIERVDRGLDLHPNNTELVEKRRKIYETYSSSLKEFINRYPQIFLTQIGLNIEWSPMLLNIYSNKIEQQFIQMNEATIWTYDLINQFRNILFHSTAIVGGVGPLVGHQSQFWWNRSIFLSLNQIRNLGGALLIVYNYRRDHSSFEETQCDPNKPFYINRISHDFPKIKTEITTVNYQADFQQIKKVENFPWTEELLTKYFDRFSWYFDVSCWEYIPWTELLLERLKSNTYQFKIFCGGARFAEIQVEEFKDILDWKGIVVNRRVCVSQAFFQKYEAYLLPHLALLSGNPNFEWTEDFISKHQETLSFEDLSGNPALPWSNDLIRMYKEKWCYSSGKDRYDLSTNKHITWTPDMLEELKDKIDWNMAAGNTSIPWTMKMIEDYTPLSKKEQYFRRLADNKTVWENVFKKHVNEDFLINIARHLNYEESINSY